LRSDADRQVKSARRAAVDALKALDGPAAGALVFDCVCRKVLLGSRFRETTQAIAEELSAPLAGFESYGEVALQAGDFSGFHNATTVVLVFPE
jgi:methyl-accepting chemotaxis protein